MLPIILAIMEENDRNYVEEPRYLRGLNMLIKMKNTEDQRRELLNELLRN